MVFGFVFPFMVSVCSLERVVVVVEPLVVVATAVVGLGTVHQPTVPPVLSVHLAVLASVRTLPGIAH